MQLKDKPNDVRTKIFQLFIYASELSFSKILFKTKIPSNLLAYFLKKMVLEGTLEKNGPRGKYKLSEKAEKLIPFFVKDVQMLSPLVVVLPAIIQNGRILLLKRNKRPYKGFWSLLSGRLLIGESIKEAAERITREKGYCDAEFKGVKSVVYERLSANGKAKHGFVFFVVEMKVVGEVEEKDFLKFFKISSLPKRKVIASDFWMIKNHLQLETKVFEEEITESKKSTRMRIVE